MRQSWKQRAAEPKTVATFFPLLVASVCGSNGLRVENTGDDAWKPIRM